ncbi:carboxypeptidase regulatory-like domain-containing protein [Caldichromatium japonicum]|uniref:Carboxypeptidase regulatory-like domain-containing protein n=1 Tax=Caldichromatium japonicum TaxID=2699430 RepID=A0A6G7VA43_9GAMM|nr:carboxypeptidase regulatory-like domain-containing protein [Caldichromatium japonicum]QIK36780.1 carboxypeptidase regulatory-like domain-containing protein [Caldichromatium japonicum]
MIHPAKPLSSPLIRGLGVMLAVLPLSSALCQSETAPPAPVEPGLRSEWVVAPPDEPPPAAQLPEGTVLQEEMVLPPGTILPGGAILPAQPSAQPRAPIVAEPLPPAPAPETPAAVAVAQETGSVPYLSGGIGLSGREEMLQVKPQFNLRLLFAEAGGAYLADIRVRIQDAAGAVLLDAVSQGPWFYVKLPPGRYRVNVDNAGSIQTRDVNIPATGGVDLNFYW